MYLPGPSQTLIHEFISPSKQPCEVGIIICFVGEKAEVKSFTQGHTRKWGSESIFQ